MLNKIRKWHKRNKDLVNTFILVLIAIYNYYEIVWYKNTEVNNCKIYLSKLQVAYEKLYQKCGDKSPYHIYGVPDEYNTQYNYTTVYNYIR